MLNSIVLLLYLVSGFQNYTNLSFNTHFIYDYVNNHNYPNSSETIVVQQNVVPGIEKEGFIFQYTGCERVPTNFMKCNFVIFNKRQRRQLSIISETTRIIDGAGNEFRALEVNIGVQKSNRAIYDNKRREVIHLATNELSTNVAIKGSAIFSGTIQNTISLFDIDFYDFRIEFNKQINAKPVALGNRR